MSTVLGGVSAIILVGVALGAQLPWYYCVALIAASACDYLHGHIDASRDR